MTGLTDAEALRLAQAYGLVSGNGVTVTSLGGGVSNDTLLVGDASGGVVLKRALAQLRTAAEWHASPTRALDEAAALRLAGRLTPGCVPPVLAVDDATATIALAAAPADWRDWKVELLAGTVRPDVGATLGTTLGAWHGATHDDPALVGGLDGMDRLESLRLVPFHDVIAGRHPDLNAEIAAAANELRDVRSCLVHGDFSPKNVLVDAGKQLRPQDPAQHDGPHHPAQLDFPHDPAQLDFPHHLAHLWVIDFEVAHLGNPVFDLAFLQAHLLLKAVALPASSSALRATADEFLVAYRRSLAGYALAIESVEARLGVHTGCLLLARIDGTSLVDYLDGAAIERVRAWGRRLVVGDLTVAEVWDEVTDG